MPATLRIGGELAQPGLHVAAPLEDLEVGAQPLQLPGAADGGGADARAVRQSVEAAGLLRDEHVGGGRALEHGGELEAGGHVARQVLQAVHGHVDLAGEQRVFEFLGEEAFAARLVGAEEREIELLDRRA